MDVVVSGQVKKLEDEVKSLRQQLTDLQTQVDGEGTKLIEIVTSVVVPANDAVRQSLYVGVNNYEVRTLYAKNVSNTNPINVVIYDEAILGFRVYESVRATETYDIVAVPMVDKDGIKSVYIEVVNNGNADAEVYIKLMLTSLK